MTTTEKEQRNLYRAVAELAYAIARTDNNISQEEIKAFQDAVQQSLGNIYDLTSYHFDFVNLKIHPDMDTSYQHAFALIEQNKSSLTRVLIRKFLYVLERVAEVMGISEEERRIIDRFEKDIYQIYQPQRNKPNIYQSSELSGLYSTIGQLAYITAMTDQVMMEEEKKVFFDVIKTNLGDLDWLAKDRFKIIDDMMIMDLESTYEHAMYLIEKNINALDEKMIEKFIFVMTEVAKVAGITPEEDRLIQRFKKDIYGIYKSRATK